MMNRRSIQAFYKAIRFKQYQQAYTIALQREPWLLGKHILGFKDFSALQLDMLDFLDNNGKWQGNTKRKKLLMVAREHFKSSCIVTYVIARIRRDANIRVLIYCSSFDNADRLSRAIRNRLESPQFKKIYGDLKDSSNWQKQSFSVKTSQVVDGYTVSVHTKRSESTGFHGEVVILEDIVSLKDRYSKAERVQTENLYENVLSIVETSGELIVVGTRYHQNDLYRRIQDEQSESDNWLIYYQPCYRMLENEIEVDENGEPIIVFKERFTPEILEEKRKAQGQVFFSLQYLLTPMPEGFQIITDSDIKRNLYYGQGDFVTIDSKGIHRMCHEDTKIVDPVSKSVLKKHKIEYKTVAIDLAEGKEASADTALVKIAHCQGYNYIQEVIARHLTPSALLLLIDSSNFFEDVTFCVVERNKESHLADRVVEKLRIRNIFGLTVFNHENKLARIVATLDPAFTSGKTKVSASFYPYSKLYEQLTMITVDSLPDPVDIADALEMAIRQHDELPTYKVTRAHV